MATLPRENWDPDGIGRGGDTYFAVLGRPLGALTAYRALLAARDVARANRSALGKAQTLAIDTVIRDYAREMERIAAQTASDATEAAQDTLESKRKRPEGGGGIPLRDLIVSRPIKSFPPMAEVGVGDMSTISQHPGWRVQELGSKHLVEMTNERRVHGLFQPGDSPPDPGQFRAHPVFQTGAGPRLIAQREVEPKEYLRTGTLLAGLRRKQRLDRLDAKLAAEVRAIADGTSSRIARARRALTRGRFRL